MSNIKMSVGYWIYGNVPDRYLPTGYKVSEGFEEKLERIRQTQGITGVELPYGPLVTMDNVESIGEAVQSYGLTTSSIAVNVTGDRKWALGSLSNPDAVIRKEAVQIIQEAMQAAKALKAKVVNLWMGQDGFDYPFEVDYQKVWLRLCEGLRECAASCPDVRLSIEYKRMEPRARNIPNSTAQSLLLAKETGLSNVGVTIDFGHALMGGENPSQSLSLLHTYGKMFHLHMNDNYADWDWDMAAGINHWWQLVEFCYWMQEYQFNDWIVLDLFPYRNSAQKVSELSVMAIQKAYDIAGKLDKTMLERGFEQHSALEILNTLFK